MSRTGAEPWQFAKLALGVLLLLFAVVLIAGGLGNRLPTWAAIVGFLLGTPVLAMLAVFPWLALQRWRASRAGDRLIELARGAAGKGVAEPGLQDEARRQVEIIERHLGASPRRETLRNRLRVALEAGGPLQGLVARAAVATGGPDKSLEEALEAAEGIQEPRQIETVARWFLRYAGKNAPRKLAALADEVPPEAKVEVVRHLVSAVGSPDRHPERESLLRPWLPELRAVAREAVPATRRRVERWIAHIEESGTEER